MTVMKITDRIRSFVQNARGEEGSLQRDAVEGVFWTSGATVVSRVVSFLRTIILARLLVPEDFGLFGTALAAFAALQVFTETGATSLLVQKQEIDDRYWNSGWVISIIRGMILCAFLSLFSGVVADFYSRPALGPILRVLALSFLLEGFNNIALIQLQKHMRFKRKVAIAQIAELCGSLAAITLGIILQSYWALVFGKLVTSVILLLLSWIMVDFVPRLRFDRSLTLEFLNFGKPMFVISVLVYIITSVDDLILGKVLGMTVLGYYTMAYGLASFTTLHVSRTIGQVVFPAYARLQDEPEKLERGFVTVFFYTTLVVAPLSIGLALVAGEFTPVVMSEQWIPMIPALRILCFLGLFRAVGSITGPLILGSGRPDFMRNNKLVEFTVFVVGIYPALRYGGIIGVCLFTTAIYALSFILHMRSAQKILPGIVKPVIRMTGLIMVCVGVMSAVVVAEDILLFEQDSLLALIVMVASGAATYLPLAFLIRKRVQILL